MNIDYTLMDDELNVSMDIQIQDVWFQLNFTVEHDFDIEDLKKGKVILYDEGEERGCPNTVLKYYNNSWEFSINSYENCPFMICRFEKNDVRILKYINMFEIGLQELKEKMTCE